MTTAARKLATRAPEASAPQYEIRLRSWGPGDDEIEVWQVPASATPHLRSPLRVAGLRGRNLELVENRVLRRLAVSGIRIGAGNVRELGLSNLRAHPITERMALTLGLLFRTLAPMRSRPNMLLVAEGIEAMGQEEAAYWLGMAMHRANPRRVLHALRVLLTDPARPVRDAR